MDAPMMIYPWGGAPGTPCPVEGCDDVTIAGGATWCPYHAAQQKAGKPFTLRGQLGNGRPPQPKPPFKEPYLTLEQRFWANVDESTTDIIECLPWLGPVDSNGYGKISFDGQQHRAHRVAWEIHHNQPVPEGLIVRHLCGNPGCVRIEHLDTGTAKDNAEDMVQHGRSLRGPRNHQARLTVAGVKEIRASSENNSALARRLGISRQAVQDVRNGRRWGWLK